MQKRTLVIGASPNKYRFSHKAVQLLAKNGIDVIPIGIRNGKIDDIKILKGFPKLEGVHTVTLYISENHQKLYFDYIVSLKPRRIIFNPGSENLDFEQVLIDKNIQFIHACTLLMVSKGVY